MCGLPISIIMQIIFFRCNKYLMDLRDKIEEFLSHDMLWPLKVLAEILVDSATSRSHLVSLFDLRGCIFQSETPPTPVVTREVWETININEAICTYGKWQLYHRRYSHLITCCTLQNMDYVQFIDDFYSNLSYKNTYSSRFQPLFDTLFWPAYTGPNVYGCPTTW
jgi:hypothetical protein